MTDGNDTLLVTSELQGTVVSLEVEAGDAVGSGAVLALVESMKLHHEVAAPAAGQVTATRVAVGDTVHPGDPLFEITATSDAPTLISGGHRDEPRVCAAATCPT